MLVNASFIRRLASIIYDALLLIAVLFVATAIILPFNEGHAIDTAISFYQLYLLVITFLFFAWFWTHGGQTLGMRAWRLVLMCQDGSQPSIKDSLVRFSVAFLSFSLLGIGFFWMLIDSEKRTWHDIASNTNICYRKQ